MQSIEKALHTPMPFTTGGQTINDRLQAAKYSLAGSQLAKSVCKASTEEVMGPKKKHVDYLLHCTHEPNVSIPQLANLLIERTQNPNWCVVYKALITMHNLMCYGNERFTQYLASCNVELKLGNFLDKTSVQGYDMSTHVRRYAKYIGEKIYTYRLCAFDFCKVKRGRDDGLLRVMQAEKLMKTLPILHGQIDALLEFQVTSNDLTNGVINSCFILMFRDLIRLFACLNDGIINLLEKYFEMNKKTCREALDIYKGFLVRMDKVAELLKVAESVGVDRGEIPDLARAPGSLLEALEQHLVTLEGGKVVTSPSSATQSAIDSFNTNVTTNLDPMMREKLLRDEQEHLEMLKKKRLEELGQNEPVGESNFNPFLDSRPQPDRNIERVMAQTPSERPPSSVDDLLTIGGDPFSLAASTKNDSSPGFSPDFNKAFDSGGKNQNIMNERNSSAFDPLGDILQPVKPAGQSPFDQVDPMVGQPNNQAGLLAGDLESSLAQLAQGLEIKHPQQSRPVQWAPQSNIFSNQQSMQATQEQQKYVPTNPFL